MGVVMTKMAWGDSDKCGGNNGRVTKSDDDDVDDHGDGGGGACEGLYNI